MCTQGTKKTYCPTAALKFGKASMTLTKGEGWDARRDSKQETGTNIKRLEIIYDFMVES